MNVEVKSVHFELPEDYRVLIEKKIHKVDFAQDMIVDFHITVTREKDYLVEATLNMRRGTSHHFRVENYDLRDGVDKLFGKIDQKISKEKEKIKDH
jgi:putative sigma-54 modulation protein